ncbi:putative MFS family arabinose efflux permease [Nocardia tenerifensis]|uniref:Putative MFS family arabinose efflux permease n=1 Tax=Nocardia tenerifensis TaxID=228006 RepID=A0A318JU27_9NOCA|nr:MFS transporter [Nocardia tenerifensis]PXX54948.1 putative MFS family arabinose efflux permease [Nocardia tenerifensis]
MSTETTGLAAPPHRARRARTLSLLTASTAMDNTESSLTTVLFPLLREALGLSSAALGTVVAVSKAVGVFAAFLWALLAQRYPRKTVLAVCSGFWGVWVIFAGFSTSFLQFVILYGIAAAGFAGAGPIALSILGDIYDDDRRGRATGILYGGVAIIAGGSAPLFGLLSGSADGWRYGYLISGGVCVLIGILIMLFLDDPHHDALTLAPTPSQPLEIIEGKARAIQRELREILRIKSFRLILLQRALSGQNVIMSFGVVFLVEERGFSTAVASVVALPFAVGYLSGTIVGGRANDAIHRLLPSSGRVVMLQASQILFAAVALLTTQLMWGSIAIYAALFGLLGFLQGQVPVVNRPLIMAVVAPRLRPLAFAVSVSMVEGLAYAGYALLTGFLGDAIGLQGALLLVTVVLTVVNGLGSAALYRPYARDSVAIPEPSPKDLG